MQRSPLGALAFRVVARRQAAASDWVLAAPRASEAARASVALAELASVGVLVAASQATESELASAIAYQRL